MDFGLTAGITLDDALEDGFQWTDTLSLLPAFTKLPRAIDGISQVDEELADLDETERAELVEKIKELDLSDDKAEAIAEQAIRSGVELGKLIVLIRESRKKTD